MDNLLLSITFEVPFDRIKAEHVVPGITELIARSRAAQAALASSTGPRTFENTLIALEQMTETLDWAMTVVRHVESVATYPEFRTAFNAVQGPVAEYSSQIVLDPGLWRVLKEYAATAEAKALTGTRRRFLAKELDYFRRHGADLDAPGKKRLEEIDVELTQITTKFSENVLDSTNAFERIVTDEADLAGLPESARGCRARERQVEGADGWRFTLQAPSYTALMTYLDDRAIRQQVWHAYTVRAGAEPSTIARCSRGSWSCGARRPRCSASRTSPTWCCDDRMAHTGARALAFLERLRAKTEARFREENQELAEFRRSLEGPDAPRSSPGTSPTTPRSSAPRCTISTKRRCARTSRWSAWSAGMFELVEPPLRHPRRRASRACRSGTPRCKTLRHPRRGRRASSARSTPTGIPRENKRGGAWMDALITGAAARRTLASRTSA